MSATPSGTVTFLFTDIEGSTTRWEQHRDAMRRALDRHDAILHETMTAHGGHVFKTVGDAFYAAFPDLPPVPDPIILGHCVPCDGVRRTRRAADCRARCGAGPY